MSAKWIKNHLSLIAGLTLPIALMLVFAVSNLSFFKSDPPRYDLVFSIRDSNTVATSIQIDLLVKDNTLYAQYTRLKNMNYWGTKHLYLFDAKTQKVRELPLDQSGLSKNTEFKEERVKSTEQLKLNTTIESPDGYTLYTDNTSYSSGLLSDLLLGSNSRSNTLCLKKNMTCIKLFNDGFSPAYYASNVQFIGWVMP